MTNKQAEHTRFSIIEEAIEEFRTQWITHLGNSMSPEDRERICEEMRRMFENPEGKLELILSIVIKRLDALAETRGGE